MRNRVAILLAIAVLVFVGWSLWRSGPRVPESAVLVLDLGGSLEEAPPVDLLEQFSAGGPALPTILLQLDKAAADDRIRALLVRIRPLQVGYARIQELRAALGRFRETGKPVVSLLDMASLNATREIYLASSANRVYVVPGFLGPFAGIAGQYLMLGGLFEKVGVRVEYERIGDYKSAPEIYASRQLSEPARQQATGIVDGVFHQIVNDVAAARGMQPADVRALVDAAPGTAEDLVRAGLADGIGGVDETLEDAGLGTFEQLEWTDYLRVDPRDLDLRTGQNVAILFGDGTILPGPRGYQRRFAADAMIDALEQAQEDESIAAVVLRINSGGGSALASEHVWRAVRALREEKPVVVSMADAAASGGYYIASAANAVFAQPGTLTGSIGVFFMRPALAGLYEKLDVGSELISRGRFAGIALGTEALSPADRERTAHYVSTLYREFVERVASGREIPAEEVDSLGRGRVWLGEVALTNGLIDGLGGLHEAVDRARELAGLPDDEDPARVILPAPRTLRRQLSDALRGEWRGLVLRALWPPALELPQLFRALGELRLAGDLAYLPTWWIDLY